MERIYSKRGTTSEKDLESSSDNEIILFPTSYLCRWKVAIKQNKWETGETRVSSIPETPRFEK